MNADRIMSTLMFGLSAALVGAGCAVPGRFGLLFRASGLLLLGCHFVMQRLEVRS